LLFQLSAAIHQVLLNVPDHQLHLEVSRILFGDLVQPVKDRLQTL